MVLGTPVFYLKAALPLFLDHDSPLLQAVFLCEVVHVLCLVFKLFLPGVKSGTTIINYLY